MRKVELSGIFVRTVVVRCLRYAIVSTDQVRTCGELPDWIPIQIDVGAAVPAIEGGLERGDETIVDYSNIFSRPRRARPRSGPADVPREVFQRLFGYDAVDDVSEEVEDLCVYVASASLMMRSLTGHCRHWVSMDSS